MEGINTAIQIASLRQASANAKASGAPIRLGHLNHIHDRRHSGLVASDLSAEYYDALQNGNPQASMLKVVDVDDDGDLEFATISPISDDRGFDISTFWHLGTAAETFTNIMTQYFTAGLAFLFLAVWVMGTMLGFGWNLFFSSERIVELLKPRLIDNMFNGVRWLAVLVISGWQASAQNKYESITGNFGRMMAQVTALAYALRSVTLSHAGMNALDSNNELVPIVSDIDGNSRDFRIIMHRLFNENKLIARAMYHVYTGDPVHVIKRMVYNDQSFRTNTGIDRLDYTSDSVSFARSLFTLVESDVLRAARHKLIDGKEADLILDRVRDLEGHIESIEAGREVRVPAMISGTYALMGIIYLFVIIPIEVYGDVEDLTPFFYPLLLSIFAGFILIPWWLGSPVNHVRRFSGINFMASQQRVYGEIAQLQQFCERELGGELDNTVVQQWMDDKRQETNDATATTATANRE